MSRTYRCRHMPTYSGGRGRWRESHARRIVDGQGGFSWKRRRQIIDRETERLYGPPPTKYLVYIRAKGLTHTEYTPAKYRMVHGYNAFTKRVEDWQQVVEYGKKITVPGRRMKTWEAAEHDRLRDQVETEYVWPTASWHPWMRRPQVGDGLKKWYRDQANRAARRYTRQLIQSQILDDDWEGYFPGRHDFFDWWAMY